MKTTRYQSMDLLRSIAILTVFLGHTVLSYGAPAHLAPLQFGGTGVDLFFVLSGWLLGGQLFKEIQNTQSVDLKRFWMRRWLRTLPAYYVVLFLSGAQRYFNEQSPAVPFEYLIFTQNYNYPLEFFTISWSLCVEEQFYLFIAPFLLMLSLMKSNSKAMLILCAVLLLPLLFRNLELYQYAEETHVRWDGCLMGVLLAGIKYQHKNLWAKLESIAPLIALIALTIYLLSYYNRWSPISFWADPDKLILALMFGSWVVLANANYRVISKLYLPGVKYIALRSYAIYLLHPESLAIMKRFFSHLTFLPYLVIAFLISLVFSEILYRVVEKPIMDLREKLESTK